MTALHLKTQFEVLTKFLKSCSVVNADGTLLFSKDQGPHYLTTTRLVAFQIVKRYLAPKPLDFFVLNDPENGGFQFSKLIFIASLHSNLFLIWDEDFDSIDFKIPPTPLFDAGVKNEFVWKALVENREYSAELESVIAQQKAIADTLLKLPHLIETVANSKNQLEWLKVSQEVFNVLFNIKAQSSGEAHFKMAPGQMIKLKLTAEEKQNVKMFVLDLTNTNLATDFHAASHVFESAAIKKINDFYGWGEFFNQSILDKIKIILPPRSIVSKPHPSGLHNIGIQAIATQLCDHLLCQFNNPNRKAHTNFQYSNFLSFKLQSGKAYYHNLITKQNATLECVEALASSQKIEVKSMRRVENKSQIHFEVKCEENLTLEIQNKYDIESNDIKFKVNGKPQPTGICKLGKKDSVEVIWEF